MNIGDVAVEASSVSLERLLEGADSTSEGALNTPSAAELRLHRKDFTEKALDILNDLREKGELCDAIIRVDDCSFLVHRNILSASSAYFKAVFTHRSIQPYEPPQVQEVVVSDVSPDVLEQIIHFCYNRQVFITTSNVESIMPAADRFLIAPLVKSCCEFLKQQLAAENCLGIARFARCYFRSGLEKTAMQFAYFNFSEVVSKSEEFLELELHDLVEYMSSDNLNVRNEESIFEAACKWISYRPEERKGEIASLLKTMRMGFLTIKYVVETIKPHPYVRESEEAKSLTLEVLKYLCNLNVNPQQQAQLELNFRLVKPRVPHEILFVIGGWSGGSPCNIMETYDTRADKWQVSRVADRGPRAYHACVVVDQAIYVVGGFDGMEYFNSCRKFYPTKLFWTEAPPMNSKRCYVSAVELRGMVYAMGGFDGHVRLNTVERLNPATNQWSFVHPMLHQRSDAKATVLDDKIYICGGFNGQECLSTAEYYDVAANQWTLITPMRNRRSGVGVVAYHGNVYALGGFNGITRMNTAERYSPQTRTWTTIPEMFNTRSNFAVGVIDDMLFAIGGFNGVTTINNVECYDATAGECGEWYAASDLSLYRSALSACVITNIPNVHDFVSSQQSTTNDPTPTDSTINGGSTGTPSPPAPDDLDSPQQHPQQQHHRHQQQQDQQQQQQQQQQPDEQQQQQQQQQNENMQIQNENILNQLA